MASDSSKEHAVFKSVANEKGEFVRKPSSFRNFVTADGSSGFPAEPDRYHLYVSLACPWAHRTLIYRYTAHAFGLPTAEERSRDRTYLMFQEVERP